MDPVRGLIHLGLKMTETTLDRALDVIRLADTLLVATAVPPLRERDADAAAWPDEEQADLDALSATLRARGTEPAPPSSDMTQETPARTSPAKVGTGARPTVAKKAPAKKAPAKKAPAKKTAKKVTASPAKKAPAKKAATSPAKKTAKKAPAAQTLSVLPDA